MNNKKEKKRSSYRSLTVWPKAFFMISTEESQFPPQSQVPSKYFHADLIVYHLSAIKQRNNMRKKKPGKSYAHNTSKCKLK